MNTILFEDKTITPSKVLCVGRNYAKHIAELNNEMPDQMVVFSKSNAAITRVLTSVHEEPLHYEGEMCFLVQGGEFVAVGFGLDLTKRGLQSTLKAKNLPWERAKSFVGAGVFDRFVALPHIGSDNAFKGLSLTLHIDDVLTQQGGVADMLFKPSAILQDLQSFTVLEDGDIVMTGTPEGVGEVKAGSRFTGRIYQGDELLVESSWLAT